MTTAKRKICEEERESEIEVKVKKKKAARMEEEDRLSHLPEALQLRILSCLDTKHAVQTSVLSKTWISLWTRIPVLDFNCASFNGFPVFDKFVDKVLCSRDPLAKLGMVKFKVYGSYCAKIVRRVFDYAFSHGVKHLKASIKTLLRGSESWPLSLCDSLTTLKLQNQLIGIMCPFQGPRSIMFKNPTVLYLEGTLITDVEPFSRFPVLDSLKLLNCHLYTEGNNNKTLRVHALRLSNLNISDCSGMNCFDLKTQKLRFLEYQGSNFLKHDGLTILQTLVIDFTNFIYNNGKEGKKRLSENLMSLFCTLPNLKSLTLSTATILLLSLFSDEL